MIKYSQFPPTGPEDIDVKPDTLQMMHMRADESESLEWLKSLLRRKSQKEGAFHEYGEVIGRRIADDLLNEQAVRQETLILSDELGFSISAGLGAKVAEAVGQQKLGTAFEIGVEHGYFTYGLLRLIEDRSDMPGGTPLLDMLRPAPTDLTDS